MKVLVSKLFVFLGVMAFLSCSEKLPTVFTSENKDAAIYPDYRGVTIPSNIAPLNFHIKDSADQYITRIYSSGGDELIVPGRKVMINLNDWKKFLANNQGKSYSVDIFMKKGQTWYKYKTIKNTIAPEQIDGYISYRLIEPGYMGYELLTINQRDLTNFKEREIYNNMKFSSENDKSQCINCHSYQNYRTGNMQMHVRQYKGGTVIVTDGKAVKFNTKSDSTLSAGVYPSWHPKEKLIAYSVNTIGQTFHSKDTEKVEVLDTESDIVLLDVEKREIRYVVRDPNSLETWPSWSPDGKMLYFASARFIRQSEEKFVDVVQNYKSIRYDLLRIPFDPVTRQFGTPDTVFRANKIGKSVALPRISPDGRYLLFTLADYGNFHIWHKSSDLYLMDLQNMNVRNLKEINSPEVDSYHSWSSNGRWNIFSTRRDDGSYTRPYITYFDKNGVAHKPFILPQKDPEYYGNLFKSFNIPEFTIEPVKLSVNDFYKTITKEGVPVTYKP